MAENYTLFSEFILCNGEDKEKLLKELRFEYEEGICCECEDEDEGVHIYAEENCNLERVLYILEHWLISTKSFAMVTVTWSFTCSKARVGEFSGGGAAITAKGIEYIDVYTWIDDKRKAHDEANNTAGGPGKPEAT